MLPAIIPIHFQILTSIDIYRLFSYQKSIDPDFFQCFVSDPGKIPIDKSTNHYSKLKYVIISVIVFGVILTIVVLAIKFSA